MGYNTEYTLTQERNSVSAETFAKLIKYDEEASYALEPDGSTAQSSKWYKHEDSMVAISQREPMVLFKLHGIGDDAGDIWDKYYVDGKKVHEVRINPELPTPDFDSFVPDLKQELRSYTQEVAIIVEAFTADEAHNKTLDLLNAAGIKFDDIAIGDVRAKLFEMPF